MSEFPRPQKIAALVLITFVVITTLIVLAARDSGSSSVATGSESDAAAQPTAIPVLDRPRDLWSAIAEDVRGAKGTTAPVDCPFVDERILEDNNFLSLTPGLTFICRERGLQARPIAPGRVVMRVTQPPLNSIKADLVAADNDGPWLRASAYGPFVVVDHGPLNGVSNVTSVYAGLEAVNPDLRVGQFVDRTTDLGTLGARMINGELVPGVMTFELVTDDTRFGADPVRQSPGSVNDSPRPRRPRRRGLHLAYHLLYPTVWQSESGRRRTARISLWYPQRPRLQLHWPRSHHSSSRRRPGDLCYQRLSRRLARRSRSRARSGRTRLRHSFLDAREPVWQLCSHRP